MTRNKLREEFNQEFRVFGNFDEKCVMPFIPTGCCILTKTIGNRSSSTHSVMSSLYLHSEQPQLELASSLQKIFPGIVAGNIKEEGVLLVEKNSPFQITGDYKLMQEMHVFLSSFCIHQRMKISRDTEYKPCYKISLREKKSESNRRK